MKTILTAIYSLLASLNPAIGGLLVAVPTVVGFFTFVHSQVVELMTRIDTMPTITSGGAISFSPLGLVDHFFPLSETITLFTAWLGVLLIASGIRIVKSFVPTLAS